MVEAGRVSRALLSAGQGLEAQQRPAAGPQCGGGGGARLALASSEPKPLVKRHLTLEVEDLELDRAEGPIRCHSDSLPRAAAVDTGVDSGLVSVRLTPMADPDELAARAFRSAEYDFSRLMDLPDALMSRADRHGVRLLIAPTFTLPDRALDAILSWRLGQYLLTRFYDP